MIHRAQALAENPVALAFIVALLPSVLEASRTLAQASLAQADLPVPHTAEIPVVIGAGPGPQSPGLTSIGGASNSGASIASGVPSLWGGASGLGLSGTGSPSSMRVFQLV